ncbi:NADH-cytochrome b5 reductase 2 [Diplonema papillatum]|nr:NADH-cytochrome b5 reductase 2 [Diplonema papillatum]
MKSRTFPAHLPRNPPARETCSCTSGEFDVANSHVLLVGAGSGLTPLYQLIFHQTAGAKNLSLYLLDGSKTVDDIWCEDALEQAVAAPSPLTSVAHFVSRGAVDTQKQGQILYNAGRVDHGAVRKVVNAAGKPWKALLCGPPKFNTEVAKACRACGMVKEDVIVC